MLHLPEGLYTEFALFLSYLVFSMALNPGYRDIEIYVS
ncbi:hypothetical protein RVIR1_01280 [Candidatus Rickettsiella viridis]|uniref:Uncharacterized protein n=1 Tax=Candidatus Rickettsiella viridis TaxID=676208 RepID=A0A2Z5UTA3_9COXI|nr:hypothetical protein RVIR1_01280 [Candidatus Rickettsiella viridis]